MPIVTDRTVKNLDDLTVKNLDDLVEFITGSDKATQPKQKKKSKKKRRKNKKKNRFKDSESIPVSTEESTCRGDNLSLSRLQLAEKHSQTEIATANNSTHTAPAAAAKSIILVRAESMLQFPILTIAFCRILFYFLRHLQVFANCFDKG